MRRLPRAPPPIRTGNKKKRARFARVRRKPKAVENMPKEARTKTKEERIRGEKNRLSRIFRELPEKKKKLALGLIERAAFMRVELEDLELDIRENGWTEPFQQSEKVDPYERQRPQGQTYLSMAKNYRDITRQLHDMLPVKAESDADPFDEFLGERDQL